MTTSRPQAEVPLHLFAAKSPVIRCRFLEDTADGPTLQPFDLAGASVQFIVKAREVDPDPAPLYTTENGGVVVVSSIDGLADIQVQAADVPRHGQFRYRVDAVKAGRRVVLAYGPLTIRSD